METKTTRVTNNKDTEESKFFLVRIFDKIFGGLKMSWPVVIIFAVVSGLYTAIVAAKVPEGNSLHDISVFFDAWILLALLVILNCKKPLEAALKVFVFFLISQPLVYLFQVLFFHAPWSLFSYYPFWFKVTLLTIPGGFVAWFAKKKAWWAGLIIACSNALLVLMFASYYKELQSNFPNHLLSAIYCVLMMIVSIVFILKDNIAKVICFAITAALLIASFVIGNKGEDYSITLDSSFLDKEGIVFEGEPYVSYWNATESGCTGSVEVTEDNGSYNYVFNGKGNCSYQFELRDDADNLVVYRYYRDSNSKELILKREF